MKHGDKKAKAARKAADQKSSKAPAQGKASKAGKDVRKKEGSPAAKTQAPKKSGGTSKTEHAGSAAKARAAEGPVSFSNAVVGAAFKRAVKKYSNAFRRLTD